MRVAHQGARGFCCFLVYLLVRFFFYFFDLSFFLIFHFYHRSIFVFFFRFVFIYNFLLFFQFNLITPIVNINFSQVYCTPANFRPQFFFFIFNHHEFLFCIIWFFFFATLLCVSACLGGKKVWSNVCRVEKRACYFEKHQTTCNLHDILWVSLSFFVFLFFHLLVFIIKLRNYDGTLATLESFKSCVTNGGWKLFEAWRKDEPEELLFTQFNLFIALKVVLKFSVLHTNRRTI